MKDLPIFSVIVPVYNVELYLRKCIDSILITSFKKIEVILVDDGSPDNCPTICDEYAQKDDRVVVIHKENGGLVSARKAGSAIAKGKYIVTVDSDDYISDTFFTSLLEIVNEYSPDIVCFGSAHFNSKKVNIVKVGIKEGYYNKQNIINTIFPVLFEDSNGKYFSPSLWSKVIKRDLYTKYQSLVDNRIKIGEDFACTRPCLYYANSVYVLEEELYYYRLNENSMTKDKKPFEKDVPFLIGRLIESTIDINQHDFQSQLYRNVVHNLFNVAYTQFYQHKNYKTVVNEIKQILLHEYYVKAISNCQYTNFKGKFMLFVLKYKLFYMLKLYSLSK